MKAKARKFAKKILQKEGKKRNIIAHDKRVCDFLYRWIIQNEMLTSRAKNGGIQAKAIKRGIAQSGVKSILLFCSMMDEVNVFGLILKLKKRGIKVYVPKLSKQSQDMQICLFRFPLTKGEFNILHSCSSHLYPPLLDLAIVPILAFDRDMRRIGFGSGYYDRFLNKSLNEPYIIFISRNLLFSKLGITNPYDVKADMVLSSRVRILKRGSGNGIFRTKPYFFNRCCFDYDFYHF